MHTHTLTPGSPCFPPAHRAVQLTTSEQGLVPGPPGNCCIFKLEARSHLFSDTKGAACRGSLLVFVRTNEAMFRKGLSPSNQRQPRHLFKEWFMSSFTQIGTKRGFSVFSSLEQMNSAPGSLLWGISEALESALLIALSPSTVRAAFPLSFWDSEKGYIKVESVHPWRNWTSSKDLGSLHHCSWWEQCPSAWTPSPHTYKSCGDLAPLMLDAPKLW